MNEAIEFDTLRFARHLTETGFASQQAAALADEIRDILKKLATKDDLARVEVALKADLTNLATKADLTNLVTTDDFQSALDKLVTRDDFHYALTNLATKADLRADIAEAKYDIIKWMAGLLAGAVIATVSLLKFF